MCHAILLTDGENEHETVDELDAALASVEGQFQCDCRGVGAAWQVSELRRIASRLLGTVDIIPEPETMGDDFRAIMHTAMGKATGNVALRLWTPQGASVAFVRQVAPTIEELTARAMQVNPLTADYPTATWGAESRDYHLCVNVAPHETGEEMLAGRVSLVEGEQVLGQALIKADLDVRPAALDQHQPRGRPLQRAGRAGRSASRTASRRANRAISARRRSSSAAPSSSRPRAATTGR